MNHKNEIMLWNIFEGRKNDKQKCLKLFNIGRSRIQRIEIQLKHSQDVESLRFCFLLHRCNKSNHCLGIDLEHSHRWLRRPWCVVAKIGITVLYAPYGMTYELFKKTYVWVVDKKLKLVDFASRWCSCRGCSCCSSSCGRGRGWSWCWSSSWSTVSVSVASAATTSATTAAASVNRDKDGCSKDTSEEFHFFNSYFC